MNPLKLDPYTFPVRPLDVVKVRTTDGLDIEPEHVGKKGMVTDVMPGDMIFVQFAPDALPVAFSRNQLSFKYAPEIKIGKVK